MFSSSLILFDCCVHLIFLLPLRLQLLFATVSSQLQIEVTFHECYLLTVTISPTSPSWLIGMVRGGCEMMGWIGVDWEGGARAADATIKGSWARELECWRSFLPRRDLDKVFKF